MAWETTSPPARVAPAVSPASSWASGKDGKNIGVSEGSSAQSRTGLNHKALESEAIARTIDLAEATGLSLVLDGLGDAFTPLLVV